MNASMGSTQRRSIRKTTVFLLLLLISLIIIKFTIVPDPIIPPSTTPLQYSLYVEPDETLLRKKMAIGLPAWAQQQIQEDLAKFTTIKKTDLGRYLLESYLTKPNKNKLVRFRIKGKEIKMSYYQSGRNKAAKQEYENRTKVIFNMLSYLLKNNYISDTDFIVNLEDNHDSDDPHPKPIFVFAKDINIASERDLILMPDPMNLSTVSNLSKRIRTTHELYPWEKKKDKLFWRGGPADSTGFRKKLVAFSKLHPKEIDAKFFVFATPEDHLQYKYLITIDGERCSWTRFVWHLHSNSLNLKHQSSQTQWFYKGIAPYTHYVPIKDEESILEAMVWASAHPKKANEIVQNALTFSEQNLKLEDMYHYMSVLLQEYSKMLR